MKNENFAFAMVFLALFACNASALIRPDVRITDYSMLGPLQPGGDSTIHLKLESVGKSSCAYRVIAQVSPQYPLSLDGPDTFVVGTLCASGGPVNLSFSLNADADASASNNPVLVAITYDSEYAAPYSTNQNLNIPITGSPLLRAIISSVNPVDIHPGDEGMVTVTLDNIGSYRAQSLVATLDLPYPLQVKPGSRTAIVAELAPKKSTAASYAIFVPKGSDAKNYAAKLRVSYADENGVTQTKLLPLDLTVAAKADLVANSSASRISIGTNNAEAKFALKNNGGATAKNLRVKLLPQFPLSTDGSEKLVGDFAPGSSAAVTFAVNADKDAAAGTYSLQILALYEDSDGVQYRETINTGISVYAKDLFTQVFSDYWFLWGILMVVIVLVLGRKVKAELSRKK